MLSVILWHRMKIQPVVCFFRLLIPYYRGASGGVSVTVAPVARLSLCSVIFFPTTSLDALYMAAAPLMVFTVFFGLKQEVKPIANVQTIKMIRFIAYLFCIIIFFMF